MPIFEFEGTSYDVEDRHIDKFAEKYPDAVAYDSINGKRYRVKPGKWKKFADKKATEEGQMSLASKYAGPETIAQGRKMLGLDDEEPKKVESYASKAMNTDVEGLNADGSRDMRYRLPNGKIELDKGEHEVRNLLGESFAKKVLGDNSEQMEREYRRINDALEYQANNRLDVDKQLTRVENVLQSRLDKQNYSNRYATMGGGYVGNMDTGYSRMSEDDKNMLQARELLLETKNVKKSGENHKQGLWGDVKDVNRTFWNTITDFDTWDAGLKGTDEGKRLLAILDKAEADEPLTNSEEMLLDAWLTNTMTQVATEVGAGRVIGQTVGQMAPFVLEMMMNPATGIGKGLTRQLMRKVGNQISKRFLRRATATGARLATDAVGAGVMAGTTGVGHVMSGAYDRMVQDLSMSFSKALGTSYADRTIENWSEMFGSGMLSPLSSKASAWATRAARKGGESGLGRWMSKGVELTNRIKNTKVAQALKKLNEMSRYEGPIEEYLEEVVGNSTRAALGLDGMEFSTEKGKGVFNLEDNVVTFLAVAVPGVAQAAVNTAWYAGANAYTKRQLNKANEQGVNIFGEQWVQIRNIIDNIDFDNPYQVGLVMSGLNATDENQAKAIADYAKAKGMRRGFDSASNEVLQDNTEQAEAEGSTAETPDEVRNVGMSMEEAEQALLGKANGQNVKDALDRYVESGSTDVAQANAVLSGVSDDVRPIAEAYFMARVRTQAYADKKTDEVDAIVKTEEEKLAPYIYGGEEELQYDADGNIVRDEKGNAVEVTTPRMFAKMTIEDVEENQTTVYLHKYDPESNTLYYINEATGKVESMMRNDPRIVSLEEVDYDTYIEQVRADAQKKIADEANGMLNYSPKTNKVMKIGDVIHTAQGQMMVMGNANGQVQLLPAVMTKEGMMQAQQGQPVTVSMDEAMRMQDEYYEAKPVEAEAPKVSPIPLVEDGKNKRVAYEQVPVEKTVEEIVGQLDTQEEVDGFIEENIKEAEKLVKNATRPAPKMGTDIAKYKEEKAKWQEEQAKLADIQKRLDYWKSVKAEMARLQGVQEDVQSAKAEKDDLAPRSAMEYVASMINRIDPESYRRETGYGVKEQRKAGPIFLKKENGGMTIEQLAEYICEQPEAEEFGITLGMDAEVRNMILDVLAYGSPKAYIREAHKEQNRKDEEGAINALDMMAQEQGFASAEDMMAHDEVFLIEAIRRNYGLDENEYYANLAEEYEKEDNYGQGNERQGDGTSAERPGQSDTTTEVADVGRSSEVLQGVQSVDSTEIEGGNEQGGLQGSAEGGVAGSSEGETVQGEQGDVRPLSKEEADAFVAQMEESAEVAPEIELTIGNWDALFGEEGKVVTPIGEVKMGENQFAKLMRQGREGKLGMIKPTLEQPHVIIEVASEAKEGSITERASSYVFVRSFKKSDGSRFYHFTSITVSRDGKEVVVSNQEKSRNRILRLLQDGSVIWRTPKDATTSSAERQGLDYEQSDKAETASKGSGITPQSTSSDSKDTINLVTSNKKEEKNVIQEPRFTEEVLENGDKRITNYNSRGEIEAISIERDGKIVSVDSYDEGVLFEHTEYDENGVSTAVTRYGKDGKVVAEHRVDSEGKKLNKLLDELKAKHGGLNKDNAPQYATALYELQKWSSLEEANEALKYVEKNYFEKGFTRGVLPFLDTAQELINKKEPLRKRVKEWEKVLGVKVNIIESFEEVKNKAAIEEIKSGASVKGWYATKSNEVYIYMPHNTSESDIDMTMIHEVVAHKGLKELLGDKAFDRLCDKVWDAMPKQARDEYLNYVGGVEGDTEAQRAAADEYIAHLAETIDRGELSEAEKTVWQSIVDFIKKLLFDKGMKITDEQIVALIKASYANMAQRSKAEGKQMFRKDTKDLLEYARMDVTRREAESLDVEGVRMKKVTDPKVIEELEKSEKRIGYRNVVLNEDGSFESPMANSLRKKGGKTVKTESFGVNEWEMSEENPDLVDENGKITLVKPNGKTVDKEDYNPYIHNRLDKVNSQFKQAWERPNLVYVETEVPVTDLESGYHADKAKKPVGIHKWNGGDLMLSRYDKPVRIVPWEEVADDWVKRFGKRGVEFDIVPPALRPVLADRGVEILPPHKGMGEDCNNAYNEWKAENEDLRFSKTLEEENNRFNQELDDYIVNGVKANALFHIGMPHGVMRMFLPMKQIVMRPHIINKASRTKHNVDAASLHNLPIHIAEPIFVFKREDNALGVLTEIKDREGKNVCVAIELNKNIKDGGTLLEVNDIRSIHGRDVKNLVLPIIHNNTLEYVDKRKGLEWLSSASSNYQQEIDHQDLYDATKIIKDFVNPKLSEKNEETRFSKSYKSKDGKETTYRQLSLFDTEGEASNDGVRPVSLQRKGDSRLATLNSLRELEDGEICNVERKFSEKGGFDFTRGEKITSVQDVAYIFKNLEDEAIENTFVAFVKGNNVTVLHIGMGAQTQSLADATAIIAGADRLNADKVYFVHNHPSGNLMCSREDINLYGAIKTALGDKLQDGIIINTRSGKYGVFNDEGVVSSGEEHISPKKEIPLKIYGFNKQAFYRDVVRMPSVSSAGIAEFISTQRLGSRNKINALLLDNNFGCVGNVFLSETDITSKNTLQVLTKLVSDAISMGARNIVIYGRAPFVSITNGKVNISPLGRMSEYVRGLSAGHIRLLDVIQLGEADYRDYRSAADEGIRFRKAKNSNNLVAVHNISESNLRKVLEMGGLIMPSIAVTDVNLGHSGYGEISLLFDKETINPSDRRNKVYGGDAWTPRFPKMEPKLNGDVVRSVRKKIEGLLDENLRGKYSLSAELHPNNIESTISNNGVEGYYGKEWMKIAYLLDNGKRFKIPMKMKDYGSMAETIIKLAKDWGLSLSEIHNGGYEFYEKNPEFVAAVLDAKNEARLASVSAEDRDKVRELLRNKPMRFSAFDTYISQAIDMERDLNNGGLKQVVDGMALYEAINKRVKTDNAEYNKWVDDLFEGVVEKYGIRNNRDWYTPSGNSRPWEQLYDAPTPANILRYMLTQNEQGGSGGFWGSNIMGASAETYESIEEIRERGKKRLHKVNEDDYEEWADSVSSRLNDICYEFMSQRQKDEFSGSIDAKIAITAAVAKDKTAKGIYKIMNKRYPKFTMEHAKRVEEIVKEIQDYAIGYFEAKPQRIVPLSEVRKAVVPSNVSSDIVEGLEKNGVEVATYRKGNEQSRNRVVKKESDSIRFRKANRNQAGFVSNAMVAVENVKQEKATPEQWLKMIEKQGGLKAGEDKWLGLSDWLKSSDKKTLTKEEVLEFIGENMIQIEEVKYSENPEEKTNAQNLFYYTTELTTEALDIKRKDGVTMEEAWQKMKERYGEEIEEYVELNSMGLIRPVSYVDEEEAMNFFGLAFNKDEVRPIESIRLDYSTEGLDNKREIALTVPTVDSWNESDSIHFGDAGNGRAVAWIRFGETTVYDTVDDVQEVKEFHEPYKDANGLDIYKPIGSFYNGDFIAHGKGRNGDMIYVVYNNGKQIPVAHASLEDARNAMNEYYREHPRKLRRPLKVLVIDEIQSKRHQEGREKGYDNMTAEERSELRLLTFKRAYGDEYNEDRIAELEKKAGEIPSAPFEKNWHELAMKRMLRLAAEEGFDKVAWTTGAQQAERYNIGDSVERITSEEYGMDEDGNRTTLVDIEPRGEMNNFRFEVNSEGIIIDGDREYEGKPLSDIVGKEIANKLMQGPTTISGQGLHIGGEGMKGFYDKMLPSFVQKYTKKWGAKVGEVTLPELEESAQKMWSVDVTDAMKESVEEQVMFSKKPRFMSDTKDLLEYARRDVERREGLIFNKRIKEKIKSDAEYLQSLPKRYELKGTYTFTPIYGIEDIEAAKKNLPDEVYKNLLNAYESDGITGDSFPTAGLVFVFMDKVSNSDEAELSWWHENVHCIFEDLDIEDKEEYGLTALGWLKDNAKEHYDVTVSSYNEEDWATEATSRFIETTISKYGVDEFLDATFGGNSNLSKLAELIQKSFKYGTRQVNKEESDRLLKTSTENNEIKRVRKGQDKSYSRMGKSDKGTEGRPETKNERGFDAIAYAQQKVAEQEEEKTRLRKMVVELDKAEARREYEQTLESNAYRFQEAWQDSMLGLKALQDAVMKANGRTAIADWENAYMAENQLSSINNAEQEAWRRIVFGEVLKEVKALMEKGLAREDISDYLMAKHGLERNTIFASRDAKAATTDEKGNFDAAVYQSEYAENRKHDYSGLTKLFNVKDVADAEDQARDFVSDIEKKYTTGNLWKAINKATQSVLDKQLQSGLITKDMYDELSNRFSYYIPLRGFKETTSDEVYDYLSNSQGAFSSPIQNARGRSSVADDPIATLANMAESGIVHGNKNIMKQRFLLFVENNPSDLVSIDDVWVRYGGKDTEGNPIWLLQSPAYTADMTKEEMEQERERFEADMEAQRMMNPDMVKRGREAEDVPYRVVSSKNEQEHRVIVKRNGKTYVLTINGNPRAAQAINGLTNPETTNNALIELGENVNRYLSSVFTSRNPAFIFANLVRDGIYANQTIWAKESPAYAVKYNKNWTKAFSSMANLIKLYKENNLDMNNAEHKMFYDFIINGGETGYTMLKSVDDYKDYISKELGTKRRKPLELIDRNLDTFNRWAEGISRYAAFKTSREMGRSIQRSIYDAKEISVNFNKKGAGASVSTKWDSKNLFSKNNLQYLNAWGSQLAREAFVFWNAGVQGLTNFGKIAVKNKGKFMAMAGGNFVLGMLMPMVNSLLAGLAGDDEDDYWNIPEYIRRNNFCLYVGGGYLKIPLPIELRAIYGLGELCAGHILGKSKDKGTDLARKVMEQVSQVMPIDLMEGGGGLMPFVPTFFKPIVEILANEDWTGMPIQKETDYNKNMPEWTKAYKNSNKALVSMAEALSDWTGGNDYKPGAVDISPAQVEHLIEGYLGGIGTLASQLYKTVSLPFDKDMQESWEFGRNAPIFNRFFTTGDGRTKTKSVTNEWFEHKEDMDIVKQQFNGFRKDMKTNDVVKFAEAKTELENLMKTEGFAQYLIWDNKNKELNEVREALKMDSDNEDLKARQLEIQMDMNNIFSKAE